jgi:DNA repair protein RecO (recombination protein O)
MEHSSAILLRKVPWSETSLIVTWLTADFGAIKTLAKGARKPGNSFAGKLDVFFHAEISFSLSKKGDLHGLREISLTRAFDATKAGSAGFYLSSYFAELSGATAPTMHPAPEIYDLLSRALDYLQREPASVRALAHFERELSRILGVFDVSGRVSPAEAIASLHGSVLASRAAALRFIAKE